MLIKIKPNSGSINKIQSRKRDLKKRAASALSQIVLLVVSIVAFSYIIGSEFKEVSAQQTSFCIVTNDVKGWKVEGNKVQCISRCSDEDKEIDTLTKFCERYATYCTGSTSGYIIREDIQKRSCTELIIDQNQIQSQISRTLSPLQLALELDRFRELAESAKKDLSWLKQPTTPSEEKQPDRPEEKQADSKGEDKNITSVWGALGTLGKNFAVAAALYFGIKIFTNWIFKEPTLAENLARGAGGGYLAGSALAAIAKLLKISFLTGLPLAWIGAGIGLIWALLSWSKEKQEQVSISCLPWDAPTGGRYCQECNKGDIPCTEYRCKALGQGCELVNKGTTEELCVWKNPRDVTPPVIEPWLQALTTGYKYVPDNTISPPDRGVRIVPENNVAGCIPPFTNLRFGVTSNEPVKCKIDNVPNRNFENMQFFFGGSSTRKHNHSQIINLISPQALEAENITLNISSNDQFSFYTKCQDENGNYNPANFVFRFCIDKGPDTTPPVIVTTSILNGMPISYNTTSTNLTVYVNEPAECRWSKLDRSYDDMENQMSCSTGIFEFNAQMLYQCTTILTGLKDREDNNFYFRCKDQPFLEGTDKAGQRNANAQSYKFVLKGTRPLVITSVTPNETTIRGASDIVKVTLKAETFAGYKDGESVCSFSITGQSSDYIEFFDTGSNKHSQDLYLPEGSYLYYVKCVDLGGNTDTKSISFWVDTDNEAPIVVRIFNQENKLKIITDENASCVYSYSDSLGCTYLIEDGNGTKMSTTNKKEHSTSWDPNKIFYIKCEDEFGNEPEVNQCSIIAKPFEVKKV